MSVMLGLLLIIGGVCLGAYLGIYIMFIGGIVQIIEAIKISPVNALEIAYGIARILFSGLIGWLTALILIGSGGALLDK